MATVKCYQPQDMFSPEVWYGYVESYSATYITISAWPSEATYYGSFDYSDYGLTGGVVTGYSQYEYGVLAYTLSGISADVMVFDNYLSAGDAEGVQEYVFNHDDQITGSEQADGIRGYDGNDTLIGMFGDDVIYGDNGNDVLDGGGDDDYLNGGPGTDTAVLLGFLSSINFSRISSETVIVDSSMGTDTLTSVEQISFGELFTTTISIDRAIDGTAQREQAHLTDLYLAYFGRAPDVEGLEYWSEQHLETGRALSTIAVDFSYSAEFASLFPSDIPNEDFVRTIYLNCFDREPDQAGWDYWTAVLDSGACDKSSFVFEVLMGAYAPTSGEDDRNLLTNKHDVSLYYVNSLSLDLSEGFDNSINELLDMVSQDSSTVVGAENVIDYMMDSPLTLTGVISDPGLLNTLWGDDMA